MTIRSTVRDFDATGGRSERDKNREIEEGLDVDNKEGRGPLAPQDRHTYDLASFDMQCYLNFSPYPNFQPN